MQDSAPESVEEYSAPSKEFKEKMQQLGVNIPDLHKEYRIPSKYDDYAHLQSRLIYKLEKWTEGNKSFESFNRWQNKLANKIVELNPSLKDLHVTAVNNDANYTESDDTYPELTHLLQGVVSQYNEDDISFYLQRNRTAQDNSECNENIDSKIISIGGSRYHLPEWVISQPTERAISEAIDNAKQRAISPDKFRKKEDNANYKAR